jgi:Mannosyltransferase (PIG-V)
MVSFVSRRRFKRVAARSVSVPSAVTPEVSDQLASTSTSAGQRQGAASLVLALRISMRWLVVNAELPGLRWTWSALWRSRLLVWAVGAVAFLALGTASGAMQSFDPGRVSLSLGSLGNVLAAPAVRWDSVWYLQIAHHGYRSAIETRFFPLYPLLIRAVSLLTGSMVVAGVLISLLALFVGLEVIRRLTELELGRLPAQATVRLIAFGPMALFLSAIYSESLFIALSAATFYAARRGRWAWAGVLGGLAGMTRIGGFLLLVPVLLLFYYGPRGDSAPRPVRSRWTPRYRTTPAILWAALIPGAAALVPTYMMLRGLGASATLHAQEKYSGHALALPTATVWDGMVAAWHQLTHQLSAFPPGTYSGQEVLQFAALTVGSLALIGVFRRLPIAYGLYVVLDFVLHLSTPTLGDPLRGFDRYTSLRFPLFMWLGAWALEQRKIRPLIAVFTAMLAFFTAQFATWHWVGTPLL